MSKEPKRDTCVIEMSLTGLTRYSDEQKGSVNADVVLKPYSALGDIWKDESNEPIVMSNVYGHLIDGVLVDEKGEPDIELFAAGSGYSPSRIQWTAVFLNVFVDDKSTLINEFIFDAEPNRRINLTNYTPVPGVQPRGIVRGLQGVPAELPLYYSTTPPTNLDVIWINPEEEPPVESAQAAWAKLTNLENVLIQNGVIDSSDI